MAIPIKPVIGTKSNFAARPSVPSSQKQNASEFNLLVEAVRANYERVILNWDTDIPVNTTLIAGQYVLFSGSIYIIDTGYNVGSPLTWNAGNASVIAGGSANRPAFADWDASVDAMPTDADGIGSGTTGAIVKGDQVIFTVAGNIGGEDWPINTVGTAKQNSPTLDTHWRLH